MTPMLIFHIALGTLGLLTGVVALSVRKGSVAHVRFAFAFWYTMYDMTVSGSMIATLILNYVLLLIGVLTLYLLATGRNALTRPSGMVDLQAKIWCGVNAACCICATVVGR